MSPQDNSQALQWHYADFDEQHNNNNNNNFQIPSSKLFFTFTVLFFIAFFVILLFIYLRWVSSFITYPSTAATVWPREQPPAADGPQGVDPCRTNMYSFPIALHGSSVADLGQGECCICLGMFQDGDKVKVLPECQHRYHLECVDKWLITHSSCPLCRASLRVVSAV